MSRELEGRKIEGLAGILPKEEARPNGFPMPLHHFPRQIMRKWRPSGSLTCFARNTP